MTELEVRRAIGSAIDRIDTEDLRVDEDFYEFGLDSLDHAQILMGLDELFGLKVADGDFDDCRSILAIIAYASRPATA